jgi:hypothetical protein
VAGSEAATLASGATVATLADLEEQAWYACVSLRCGSRQVRSVGATAPLACHCWA